MTFTQWFDHLLDRESILEAQLERRKDGWTWTKEIVGTIVGVAAVMSVPTAYLFNTLHTLQARQDVHEVKIQNLEGVKVDLNAKIDRLSDRSDKILEAVNDVRVRQAATAAGIK